MSTTQSATPLRDALGRFIPRSRVETETVSAEPQKTFWQEQGFQEDSARLAAFLEAEPERFALDVETRETIEIVMNATSVSDFAAYNDERIEHMLSMLQYNVPQLQQQINGFVSQLSRIRLVQNDDIDYI